MDWPRFRAVADHAVMVAFCDVQDAAAHARVLHLDQALRTDPCPGLTEALPAMVSLLVDFDPRLTDHRAVADHVRGLLDRPVPARPAPPPHEVPVCYDAGLAPDLDMVARLTGLTPQAVIAQHLAGTYHVAMYGFAPGYAYLTGVPAPLWLDRKPAAVRNVPAGSVIIAGGQCLVTTLTMPTGWWVIGRSPARILTGDADRPFLFDVGAQVRFRRMSRAGMDP